MESNGNYIGYTGKILRINLSNLSITKETPSESFCRHYLGGRGVVMHSLHSEARPMQIHWDLKTAYKFPLAQALIKRAVLG